MRFQLGQVWKTVDAAPPLRAVVVGIDDDGRRGKLYFDDDSGTEDWVLWFQFTQPGHWQLETSEKPALSADELRTKVLRKALPHPACPSEIDIKIRGTGDGRWVADFVPPAWSPIAYADCAQHLDAVARIYRWLYDLRPEAKQFTGTIVRVEPDGFGIVEFDTPIGPLANISNGIFSTTVSSSLPHEKLRTGARVNGTAEIDQRDLAAVKTLRIT